MNPPPFATHWARELGAAEESLIQLRGGINNRVYRCGEGVESYVIKGYEPAECGKRDRMKSEIDFLGYAAIVSSKFVPKLVCTDLERRCVVMEYIEGSPYPEGLVPPASDVNAAVEFFQQLNADRGLAQQYLSLDAAEGYLRLRDHITNIQERHEAMCTDHLPLELQPSAAKLLAKLKESTERVADWTEALIASGTVADAIRKEDRIVSPSDFGFHNAMRTQGGVSFFDFEFAGWDDPAKASADFILQPRIPTNSGYSPLWDTFADDIRVAVQSRCKVLGVILRLKWIAIILKILQPQEITKMLTTHRDINIAEQARQRLRNAAKYFSEENPFGLHRLYVPAA